MGWIVMNKFVEVRVMSLWYVSYFNRVPTREELKRQLEKDNNPGNERWVDDIMKAWDMGEARIIEQVVVTLP
jgi:hypothetical protein